MSVWSSVGLAAAASIGVAALIGYSGYRRAASQAEQAYAALLTAPGRSTRRFDPREVDDLPEIARRYFSHAIAPGTPVYSAAEVRMEGTFLLGDRRKFQTYEMTARQALRPPDQFVWIPTLRSGLLAISGSDAIASGKAWTRFWMLGVIPVANDQSSPDLVRSAQFRAAVEGGLWLPTSLLPENDVVWSQTGPDRATVVLQRFKPEPITLLLTLSKEGGVREVVGQRWSNANPNKRFCSQPFGGTILREGTFSGLTIPTQISVGNHYGTPNYLPFFQAKLIWATYR